MTNKEAIDRLNELLKCTSLLSDADHESMRVGIKALEVVEEIEKAFISRLVRQDNVIVFNNANYTYFTDTAYHILCDAYGTEESSNSWIKGV